MSGPSRVHWELIVGGVLLGFSWVASIFWLNTFLSDQYFYLSLLIVIVCYMAILAVSAVVPGVYLAHDFFRLRAYRSMARLALR